MNLDRFVFSVLLLSGIGVLMYSATDLHKYPYFLTSTIVVAVSIGLFFIFLQVITKKWLMRLLIINGITIVLLPLLEGDTRWIWVSFLYGSLLLCTTIAYALIKR
ncbi:hypothetical protein [Alteribacter aurantiacus]|uniref:hypothetical protein n=1 Tax=Alteribacter aurantiacus TaxID=254410 RepID=UPI00042562C5|nr:hypothetical protein [Alteribacter aurantiacus]